MCTCARWRLGVRQKVGRKAVVPTEVNDDDLEAQNMPYVWDIITRRAVFFRRPKGLVCSWHLNGISSQGIRIFGSILRRCGKHSGFEPVRYFGCVVYPIYAIEEFRRFWTRCYACGNRRVGLPPEHVSTLQPAATGPHLVLGKRSSISRTQLKGVS